MTNTGPCFTSFEEWRQAITERCKIQLTQEYTRSRITALQNASDKSTQEFTEKYGETYLQQVIEWFEMAEKQAT